jgi:alkanesulfonate monooxygenase
LTANTWKPSRRLTRRGGFDFDRAFVAFNSISPQSVPVAAHAASVRSRLGFMIAHRRGFTAPTRVARQFATLEYLEATRAAWTDD